MTNTERWDGLIEVFGCKRSGEDCTHKHCGQYFRCEALAASLRTTAEKAYEQGKSHGKTLAEYDYKYKESDEHVQKCCDESYKQGWNKSVEECCFIVSTFKSVHPSVKSICQELRKLRKD